MQEVIILFPLHIDCSQTAKFISAFSHSSSNNKTENKKGENERNNDEEEQRNSKNKNILESEEKKKNSVNHYNEFHSSISSFLYLPSLYCCCCRCCSCCFYTLYSNKPGVIFKGLLPCLFSSSTRKVKRGIKYLFRNHHHHCEQIKIQQTRMTNNSDKKRRKKEKKKKIQQSSTTTTTTRLETNKTIMHTCRSNDENNGNITHLYDTYQNYDHRYLHNQNQNSREKIFLQRRLFIKNNEIEDDVDKKNMTRIILWIEPLLLLQSMPSSFLSHFYKNNKNYHYKNNNNNYYNAFYFGALLLKFENFIIRNKTAIAYLSSMGGGYYYCKEYEIAILISKKQKYYASLLHDYKMMMNCDIQIAYNYIGMHLYDVALSILNDLLLSLSSPSSSSLLSASLSSLENKNTLCCNDSSLLPATTFINNSDLNKNIDRKRENKKRNKKKNSIINGEGYCDPKTANMIIRLCNTAKLFCVRKRNENILS